MALMSTRFAVQTIDLTKIYPQARGWRRLLSKPAPAPPALHKLNLEIRRGELYGLLGPNGAGKTTLLKVLSTLIVPTSGKAYVLGDPLSSEQAIKANLGLMTSDERSFYWRLSGRANLEFFAALHGLTGQAADERITKLLSQVELETVADRRFMSYSTGMRQRLALARALINQPELLFLDEPTRGLDPSAAHNLHNLIKTLHSGGTTILLTTHNLAEAASLCERIAILDQGVLRTCGTLPELRRELDFGDTYRIQVIQKEKTPASIGEPPSTTNSLNDLLLTPVADRARPTFQLEITQSQEDTRLAHTLNQLNAAGYQVISVHREEHSLEAIFQHHTTSRTSGELDVKIRLEETEVPPTPVHSPHPIHRELPFYRLSGAFLRRDFTNEASYRLAFVLQFANIIFSVGLFYFLAQLVGPAAVPYLQSYGGDYFAFVLIGIAFSGYFGVGLSSFASSLRQAQTTGTLEAMLATPTGLSAIILNSSLWDYLLTTLRVAVYLLIGSVFLDVNLSGSNLSGALATLILTIITFASLGILSASFIMVLKRGDPIAWAFNAVSTLLGGVYYPIAVLPGWLQFLAHLLPVTYALEAMRLALLQGAGIGELVPQLLPLVGFSLVLMPLSLLAFRFAVRRARIEGSLTHY